MELCIQYLVLDSTFCKHTAQFLRSIDRDRTNQHRLSFIMCIYNCLHDSIQLLLLRLEDRIRMIDSLNRKIGRNNNDIHAVDLTELFFFGKCGTCHTCLLLIFVEEVLEGNCRQCTALTFYLYIFLRLDCLMQTI